MKRFILPVFTIALIALTGCQQNNPAPSNSNTNNNNNNNNNTSNMYHTVNGTNYPVTAASNLYYDWTNMDGSYLAGNLTPQANSVFQLTWVDPNPLDSIPDGTYKIYYFATDVYVMPSPSYGYATVEVVQNLSQSNEIVWEPTGGTLKIQRAGNNYTFTWTNVPVRDDNNTSVTSTSSASFSILLQ